VQQPALRRLFLLAGVGHNRRDSTEANTMADFWRSPLCLAPRHLRPWLSARASLTARLSAAFGPVRVQVLAEKKQAAHREEWAQFGNTRPAELRQIREALLLAGPSPLIFAHSVARRDACRQGLRILGKIGARPLGAALFADPKIRRSALSWKRIDRRDPLWQKAKAAVGPLPARLWARRSQFLRGHARLLVTEVFLWP